MDFSNATGPLGLAWFAVERAPRPAALARHLRDGRLGSDTFVPNMFRLIALHYPKLEHREEMVRRLRRANEVVLSTPGCLGSEVWLTDDAVVTIGTWETKAQSQGSFAALKQAGVDWEYDERESRPRMVYALVETSDG